MKLNKLLPVAGLAVVLPSMGFAQDAAAAPDIQPYIMTTLLFLVGGFLVFWMAAGFAMLEAGLVRSKNVSMQLIKNISLFSMASIMYWLVGFNLMYPGDFNGYLAFNFVPTVLEPVGLAAADASLDYASVGSDFFFQLMFVAATAGSPLGSDRDMLITLTEVKGKENYYRLNAYSAPDPEKSAKWTCFFI